MAREQLVLNPEIVEEISKILNPYLDEEQTEKFNLLKLDWEEKHTLSCRLRDEVSELLTNARASVEDGQSLVNQAEKNWKATLDFIINPEFSSSKGQLAATWGTIRVLLHLSPGHPWLIPIDKERKQAQAYLTQTKTDYQAAQGKIAKEINPQVVKVEAEQTRVASKLLDFAEEVVVVADETLAYAQIMPSRIYSLADKYGDIYHLSANRIPDLIQFTLNEEGYLRSHIQRDRKFRTLLKDPSDIDSPILVPLLEVPAEKLPDPVKNRLRAWTIYNFLLTLSEEGLVMRPDVPDILREL